MVIPRLSVSIGTSDGAPELVKPWCNASVAYMRINLKECQWREDAKVHTNGINAGPSLIAVKNDKNSEIEETSI